MRLFSMTSIQYMMLKPGDTVAVAATARKVTTKTIKPAVKLLESWGLRVRIPEGLYASENQFAGCDSHRAAVMQALLDDPMVKAVFCARGGYGTVRILDKLDFTGFVKCPKWIVGYSDVTALHSHVSRLCGVPTMHATMPINIPADSVEVDYPSLSSLRHLLFGMGFSYDFKNEDVRVENRPGKCRAPIVGGNLSVIYSLLGSSSEVDTRGKILLIEDLDEMLYHIDRMMMALKRAGKLEGLKGLIVGAMTKMRDNRIRFGRTAEEIVRDAVADYDYPVAFHCQFGHIGTENLALPLGVPCELKVADTHAVVRLV